MEKKIMICLEIFLIFNFVDLSFAILVVKNRATHLFESFSNSRLFKLFNFSIIGQ